MAELNDSLEQALESLAPAGADRAPPPPAEFLRAVGRRRAQRRVRMATTLVLAVAVVGAGVVLMARAPQRPGLPERPRTSDATPWTIGSVNEYRSVPVRAQTSPGTGRIPAPVHAADWRSHDKLEALVGSS